jgi:uncharacterized protein YjiS (DUF1127 family)
MAGLDRPFSPASRLHFRSSAAVVSPAGGISGRSPVKSSSTIAPIGSAATLFRSLRDWLRYKRLRRTQICELTRMAELDNYLLRDIGVSRDDIRYALHQLRRRP